MFEVEKSANVNNIELIKDVWHIHKSLYSEPSHNRIQKYFVVIHLFMLSLLKVFV